MIPFTPAIVFALLFLNTKSVVETLIVMLAVPFSSIGAVWLLCRRFSPSGRAARWPRAPSMIDRVSLLYLCGAAARGRETPMKSKTLKRFGYAGVLLAVALACSRATTAQDGSVQMFVTENGFEPDHVTAKQG